MQNCSGYAGLQENERQIFSLFYGTNMLIHGMSCHEFCDKRVRDMKISLLLKCFGQIWVRLNPTFNTVTIHNACLRTVLRPRIVCSALEKIMYTVCFETFNIRSPEFSWPIWIEIFIIYLAYLNHRDIWVEQAVVLASTQQRIQGIKELKLVTPSTRLEINAKYPEHPCYGIDCSEETNDRNTPCNVAMPTWTALRSPFFTCNHPMKFTAKYYHPISNRAHTFN